MNRESDLLREITEGTEKGAIQWDNVSPSRYAEYIFQSPFAYQAFRAKFPKGHKDYILLLVHKKVPSHNSDFEVTEERHSTELLVLLDGRLISTLTKYEVNDRELADLASSVEQRNADFNDLFA